jgi:membrane peptidoglycan carboxypeptidase
MVALVGGSLSVALFSVAVVFSSIPTPNQVAVVQSTAVFYADGKSLIGNIGEIQRVDVKLNEFPDHVKYSVLAIEDKAFYEHAGFSPIGIARALFNNLFSSTTQGGSTITQQYVKNAYLTQEQTIIRKVKELVLAVKLETLASKDEILENYLNTAYMGRSSYGFEAASQAYFGKSVRDLSLSEGAALAALLRSPGGYSPENNAERLENRWNFVLRQMVNQGWATEAEKEVAQFPKFKPKRVNRLGGPNGHLLAYVRTQLDDLGFTEQEIELNGLQVITTFERDAQLALNKAVREVGPRPWSSGLRIGVASVRVGTGEIVAMYGGRDYVDDQFNNATQARGQAGSTFKAFGLAAALEQGIGFNTTWNGDSPATILDYKLNNLGKVSYGKVTLLQALEKSMNTPMVALGAIIGPELVEQAAIRAGVPETTPGLLPVLSTIIGTSSPRPIDIANGYATFAARGQVSDNSAIKEVRNSANSVLWSFTPNPQQVFSTEIADELTFGLQRVVTKGTGATALGVGRPVAGKTGTSDDNLSAWFVGYTPQIATAVMMVREDESGTAISLRGTGGLANVTGSSFPARIFTQYMREAHTKLPVIEFPKRTKIGDTTDYSTYFLGGEVIPPDEAPIDPDAPTSEELEINEAP